MRVTIVVRSMRSMSPSAFWVIGSRSVTRVKIPTWRALSAIPAGSTASYTEIAKRIGAPTAVRAVAHACASNVIAIAIPCHRVVRSDGSISGYRWGVERKRALLAREQAS